ncbi:hydrogenase maturation protein [Sulfurimonas sp. RIFOXYB12_FULL_35_9]|uniref:hydrogenase maturation protein n=1 Tax=Sulfurimonas sp. RIFOXYB12_FULL_35_9 TaxID=1802256 RepID=UPI0008D484AB|nr:hydrogenase maturation protein [Sulfurimonas sp. RIFOXYB12_FULL_35_9]MBS4069448.1 hydrogenase [Sulfurimonas sp.]OHE04163.1 MAG: hydrogenase [Sulfurimonas sp. RIFOXYB12_FULL_35_9]
MKILLLVSAFNSLSQRVFCELRDMQHVVSVQFSTSDKEMIEEAQRFKPDIIFCPYLKKYIPKELFLNTPTFILHPGIRGDRGHNALDHAIRDDKKEWGVVILRANEEFDGGDIYAHVSFKMRDTYKASLYRNEVANATSKALKILLESLNESEFEPISQLKTKMHAYLTQEDRAIDWQRDTTKEIIKKIHVSDSFPGVKDEFLGVECYLFGAWEEESLKGDPKEIIAKRDGAVCVGTIDGALWISHMLEVGRFKLPSTYVLKEKIKGVKEVRTPLVVEYGEKTFHEISYKSISDVCYMYFNFHNGAMSSEQCIRLKYAFEYLKESHKVIVLMGGEDFFSNGIHLNILEDSQKQGEDGWSNINAMNDVVKSILCADDVITVASLGKNAGAGGVFLALACDYVVAKEGVVLNPHYKTLGLSGSEYHTYTLEKRVTKESADRLLSECLPISVKRAFEIGMIDKVYEDKNYFESVNEFAQVLTQDEDKYNDFLYEKEECLSKNIDIMEQKKEEELKVMYAEFWDKESLFHKLRYEFVYKICQIKTPQRLKEV